MGQKVHPKGLRLGIIKDWDARWYADKNFKDFLEEDQKIRRYLKKRNYDAGVSRIEIERVADVVQITLYIAKPGLVIGRGGKEVKNLREELFKMIGKQVFLNIVEVKKPEIDAQLVAENVASQLERRVSFRRAIKQATTRAMRSGAEGAKIMVSGRLGGAEIARREWYSEGKVPLQTLRAEIDYGFAEANTTYGKIGVKVWIYKGEVLPQLKNSSTKETEAAEAVKKG